MDAWTCLRVTACGHCGLGCSQLINARIEVTTRFVRLVTAVGSRLLDILVFLYFGSRLRWSRAVGVFDFAHSSAGVDKSEAELLIDSSGILDRSFGWKPIGSAVGGCSGKFL